MKRHYYISDDLDELERVEMELEAQGISTPQIHVLSLADAEVARHKNLHPVESVLKKDVVHGTNLGALVGVVAAIVVLAAAYIAGWPETVTWVPFVFLSIVVLGFCTWEGGLIGIQEPHHDFKRFNNALKRGKHVFFVDIAPEQENILNKVMPAHSSVRPAGEGSATPGFVVRGREKWDEFVEVMP